MNGIPKEAWGLAFCATISTAMRKAKYENLPDDKSFYAQIPGRLA